MSFLRPPVRWSGNDLGFEARGEDDVRLARDGVFLGEASGDGGAGGAIDQRAVEGADGQVERAAGRHGGGFRGGGKKDRAIEQVNSFSTTIRTLLGEIGFGERKADGSCYLHWDWRMCRERSNEAM